MAKEWAKSFYNTKAWKECRKSYMQKRISIDGGMCETCGRELGYIVHHKEWLTPENINDPLISLNHDNLKYDCLICHNQEEKSKEEDRCYYFDSTGDIIFMDIPPFGN